MAAKKKPVAKKSIPGKYTGDRLLFRRTKKPTRAIVAIADLWMEFFVMFCDTVAGDDNWSDKPAQDVVARAQLLADAAIDVYQNRWPNVEPPPA